MQHRDRTGNIILDPDRTNPTRSRLERPLDTIRSFEAAIDGSQKRRSHAIRTESTDVLPGMSSKRSSMYMSHDMPHSNPRYSPSNAYGNSRQHAPRSAYGSNYESYGTAQYPQRRVTNHRTASAPFLNRMSADYSVYPVQTYHESHDTINTAAESNGSQSTEPWGNSTDPSSENSSVDRVHAVKHMESGDAYGGQYGRGSPIHSTIQEESWHDGRSQYQGSYTGGASHPVQKVQNVSRPPVSTGYAQPPPVGQASSGRPAVIQGPSPYANNQSMVKNGPSTQRTVIRLGDGASSVKPNVMAYARPNGMNSLQPNGMSATRPNGKSAVRPNSTVVPQYSSTAPTGTAVGQYRPNPQTRPQPVDEKKSWLKRRFTKT